MPYLTTKRTAHSFCPSRYSTAPTRRTHSGALSSSADPARSSWYSVRPCWSPLPVLVASASALPSALLLAEPGLARAAVAASTSADGDGAMAGVLLRLLLPRRSASSVTERGGCVRPSMYVILRPKR